MRASYVAYDHHDEVTSALSCAFSPDGEQIYAGFERTVRVWQTARPGREAETRKTSATRASKQGQKGLISTLAVNCDGSVYAAGKSRTRFILPSVIHLASKRRRRW